LVSAHARAGQPAFLAGYLRSSAAFDEALAAFALAYADQNDRDYESFWTASAPDVSKLSRDVDRRSWQRYESGI